MEDTPLYTPAVPSQMDRYSPKTAWYYFVRVFLGLDVLVLAIGILFFSPLSTQLAQLFEPVLHAWGPELEQLRQGWMQFVKGFWGMVPAVLLAQLMLFTALYRGNLYDLADVPLRRRLLWALCAQVLALVGYVSFVVCTGGIRDSEYLVWTTLCTLCMSVLTVIAGFLVIFDLD